MKKNFAITGTAGYVAPRHLQAIEQTGNCLVAAVDPHDSVGILDNYFEDVSFFTEFERFDRHVEKLRRGPAEGHVHYVSICSPNQLHDAHIRFALRVGAHAICEKPIVLNPWNCEALAELEQESQGRIYTILQLRLHPDIIALKEKLTASKRQKKHEIELSYITGRGKWYHYSWKGVREKSGGLATNIGIHFFDMLIWLFGDVQDSEVHFESAARTAGVLELANARVKWFLSIDRHDLPFDRVNTGRRTYRSILIDGEEVEFSDGFADLHTASYRDILNGKGFGIADARPSIELCQKIRSASAIGLTENAHPLLAKAIERG